LISWDKLILPKYQGGLGLRDPDVMSMALGAKIWWQLVQGGEQLWIKIWNCKYRQRIILEERLRSNES